MSPVFEWVGGEQIGEVHEFSRTGMKSPTQRMLCPTLLKNFEKSENIPAIQIHSEGEAVPDQSSKQSRRGCGKTKAATAKKEGHNAAGGP